ncbi:hypothetical protein RFI_18668 [Reticulomyxa filosa]|uniref:PH domain-containing protein n=1 Tax=Reticulomyxa filosa TaxID=46433 RepID=X6MY86_RETFI|nr:hypothetical protein RFI_18668 [Reticulomyxa filosa]|eukprot:ETO18598.1 hypothetical protein RFI_18668 [Reticulomyxa filosa]
MAQEMSLQSEDTSHKPIRKGILSKKGNINKSWRKRFFVLYEGRKLAYFEKEEDFVNAKYPIREIDLSSVQSVHLIPSREEHKSTHDSQQDQAKRDMKSAVYGVVVVSIHIFFFFKKKDGEDNGNLNETIFSSWLEGSNTMLADGGTSTEEFGNGNGNETKMDMVNSPSLESVKSNGYNNNNNMNPKRQSQQRKKKYNNIDTGQTYVDKEFAFAIVTSKRTYVLCASDNSDLHNWRSVIEKAAFGGRLHQGWLTKRGARRKSWKKRWFVLFDTHELRYYDNERNMCPIGLIQLKQVLLMCPGDRDQYTF